MPRRLLVVSVGAFLSLAARVDAQVCNGFASFAQRPFQLFGSALFNDNAKAFAAGFAFGGPGPFAQVALGRTSFDDFDGSTLDFSVTGGHQTRLDREGVFHLCPLFSIAYASGPKDVDVFGDGSLVLDLSETDVILGIGFGALTSRTAATQVIPTASLSLVYATVSAKDQVSGVSDSENETFGLLGLGVGFVFSQSVTLRPNVLIPFGVDGASTAFGAILSMHLGRRSAR